MHVALCLKLYVMLLLLCILQNVMMRKKYKMMGDSCPITFTLKVFEHRYHVPTKKSFYRAMSGVPVVGVSSETYATICFFLQPDFSYYLQFIT